MEFKDLTEEDVPASILRTFLTMLIRQQEFMEKLAKIQADCEHQWEKVMQYDKGYSPMVGQRATGENILVGWRCGKCKLFKPRPKGLPFKICHKCGGKMDFDRSESVGQDRVHINKCVDCGHEYDTT